MCKSGWGSGTLLCNNYPWLSSVPTDLRAVLVDVASLCSGNILSACEGRPWHTGKPYYLRDCIFLELRELQQGVFAWCCMYYVGPYSSAWQRSWIDLHDFVLAISSVTCQWAACPVNQWLMSKVEFKVSLSLKWNPSAQVQSPSSSCPKFYFVPSLLMLITGLAITVYTDNQ